jgi:O-antigen/teichoic acid export membrane protein
LLIPVVTFVIPIFLPFLITKPEYAISYLFLSILNIRFAFNAILGYFQAPIYYLKETKVLPKVFLISAIIQILATIVLVKYLGLWGAVLASLISKFVQSYMLYIEGSKFFTFQFNVSKLIVLPLGIVVLIMGSEFFITQSNMHFIRFGQMAFSGIFVFAIYYREIIALLTDMKNKYLARK